MMTKPRNTQRVELVSRGFHTHPKSTHFFLFFLYLDTYPELVKATKNEMEQGDWAIVLTLGDFYDMKVRGKF